MEMSIAALSVDLAQTQQDLGVSVMKMAMETSTEQVEEILAEIGSLDPNIGNNIDIIA